MKMGMGFGFTGQEAPVRMVQSVSIAPIGYPYLENNPPLMENLKGGISI